MVRNVRIAGNSLGSRDWTANSTLTTNSWFTGFGRPLYRLYTIIPNKHLVDWSEPHDLRSPAQAGSRPQLSAAQHLFALRAILWMVPVFAKRPFMHVSLTFRRHMILSSMDYCEDAWLALVFKGACLRPFSHCMRLALSMKVGGTAGRSQVQQMDVRQGCPLSPTLFGLFFHSFHEHLNGLAPAAGLLLRSGRHVPFLCYADGVVVLSDSSAGLQLLIDGMHQFCSMSGLVISVAKKEVVVFHGSGVQGSWSLPGNPLPWSWSFKYLGLVFHESWELGPMLRQLHSAGQGAKAKLQANFGKLGCSTLLPMLLRLFTHWLPLPSPMAVRFGGHIVMATLFLMPKNCRACSLSFCKISVVACLSAFLQLPFWLSWLRTHAVFSGGCTWWGLPYGSLTCRRVHCTVRS